jgi:hypothetical protein
MLQVHWIKALGGKWCHFETVTLPQVKTEGVYVIWHAGNPAPAVRLGQGDIADRLTRHRADPAILAYRAKGLLLVTWASVPAAYRDGVERFLADYYQPLIGSAFPNVPPIEVNLVA